MSQIPREGGFRPPFANALTEADIRTKFILPAIDKDKDGDGDVLTQVLEEHYFTKGRVMVRGKTVKRGEANKADYVLFYKPNIPLAVIEAKDNKHTVGAGMQQALEYAEILDQTQSISSTRRRPQATESKRGRKCSFSS